MKTFTPSLVVIAALLCAARLSAAVEEPAASMEEPSAALPETSFRIKRYVSPEFPKRMSNEGKSFGEARVVLEVDEQGRLTDCLVTAYTDKGFADATVKAIQSWLFEPAMMAGKPVSTVAELTMHFRVDGVMLISSYGQVVERPTGDLVYKPCASSRLDHLPKPIEVVEPYYPKQFYTEGATGKVTLDFYIDESGRVRVPEVKDASENFLAATAVEAVKEWRFEPPTSRGKPVLVRVSQSFNFVPRPGN